MNSQSRITPGSLYRAVLLAFGLVVAALVFKQLVTLLLGVLIVVIITIPVSAVASWLQRFHIPREIGTLFVLALGFSLVAGLIAAIVPVFSHEINQFAASLPSLVDDLRHRLGKLTGTSPSHVGQQAQHFIDAYTQHPTKLLGPLESVGASVVTAVGAMIVVLLTALYAAIRPQPLLDGMVRMVPPAKRPAAEAILSRLRTAYLGWLRGLTIGMLALGGLTYLGLRVVGIPFAAFFAVFTAVAMIIPYFGALISSIPPILLALTISPGRAVIVAVMYIVVHQVESNMIQPLVVARTVQLHPAVVAVGVIAVETLFGFVGLIVAVPILVTIKILIEELWVKPVERSSRRMIVEPDAGMRAEDLTVASAAQRQ